MFLQVKRLTPEAKLPQRGSVEAAGYDVYSTSSHVIKPGQRALVSTGISISIPLGTYARIAPRSGLAVKNGIHVGAGVVDSDYRGEVKVLLYNLDPENDFVVEPGNRIAQFIIENCNIPCVEEVDDLGVTKRAQGGFGSTDIENIIRA